MATQNATINGLAVIVEVNFDDKTSQWEVAIRHPMMTVEKRALDDNLVIAMRSNSWRDLHRVLELLKVKSGSEFIERGIFNIAMDESTVKELQKIEN